MTLSIARYRRLQPATQGLRGVFHRLSGGSRIEAVIDEHLRIGDSRAAMVVSLNPLLVAAYTDELDAVCLLSFPPELVQEHALTLGARLLTVNTYCRGPHVVSDLVTGPGHLGRWVNFFPIIAEFVSEDRSRIEHRKRSIAEAEWQRCEALARAYVAGFPTRFRDGSPLRSVLPAR